MTTKTKRKPITVKINKPTLKQKAIMAYIQEDITKDQLRKILIMQQVKKLVENKRKEEILK